MALLIVDLLLPVSFAAWERESSGMVAHCVIWGSWWNRFFMNGEGGTGKIRVAPGHGVTPGREGAADAIRPFLALSRGQAIPPGQGRFRLGFVGNKGRGIVYILLTAAGVLVPFIFGYRLGRVVGVFPAPVEGNGMNRPTPLF